MFLGHGFDSRLVHKKRRRNNAKNCRFKLHKLFARCSNMSALKAMLKIFFI